MVPFTYPSGPFTSMTVMYWKLQNSQGNLCFRFQLLQHFCFPAHHPHKNVLFIVSFMYVYLAPFIDGMPIYNTVQDFRQRPVKLHLDTVKNIQGNSTVRQRVHYKSGWSRNGSGLFLLESVPYGSWYHPSLGPVGLTWPRIPSPDAGTGSVLETESRSIPGPLC